MVYKRDKHWHTDVTVSGVRYREALNTTDRREAKALEHKRISEIRAGKAASPAGREFARKPFGAAADQFIEDRKPHVSDRTSQLEKERLKPLRAFFGDKPILRIKAGDIAAYQRNRRAAVSGRTVNMEVGVLRQMMKRAKAWNTVAEDITFDRENTRTVGKVLTAEQKQLLFDTAASKDAWMVAYCAAVLAVSTTCRGVELKHLRWSDIDLFGREVTIRRSKTEAGERTIPLNGDAIAALARLLERARLENAGDPEHFIFPACEPGRFDPTQPQKTWRTAWRSLVDGTAKRAGDKAAEEAKQAGQDEEAARRRAVLPYISAEGERFRFHDLRHQAITELAEGGISDATLMSLAGHMSRKMMEHYSHVRMAAKREAVGKLSGGLMKPAADPVNVVSNSVN